MAETSHIAIKHRRQFLKTAASGLFSALCLPLAPAWAAKLFDAPQRSLSLYNTHTGESLERPYWEAGKYLDESLSDFSRLMRDHRTNEIAPIDVGLLDLLHALYARLEGKQAFHLISGFRSTGSNQLLVATTHGVAKSSLHMRGQAADIFLPGCDLARLRGAALAMRSGGVGYYPASHFVHVDTGRVRAW